MGDPNDVFVNSTHHSRTPSPMLGSASQHVNLFHSDQFQLPTHNIVAIQQIKQEARSSPTGQLLELTSHCPSQTPPAEMSRSSPHHMLNSPDTLGMPNPENFGLPVSMSAWASDISQDSTNSYVNSHSSVSQSEMAMSSQVSPGYVTSFSGMTGISQGGLENDSKKKQPQQQPQQPQKSKPKRKRIITKDQRSAANIRERRRMVTLNDAFDNLKQRIPTFSHEKKLSRIETLRLAMAYISFMKQLLNGKDPHDVTVDLPYVTNHASKAAFKNTEYAIATEQACEVPMETAYFVDQSRDLHLHPNFYQNAHYLQQ